MKDKMTTRLVREGNYVAEIEVNLIYDDNGWSPYLSLDDAYRLDDVRDALKQGDFAAASKLAKVFSLTPLEE